MEEKTEGTPNPLNPNLEATPLDANPSDAMNPMELNLPEPAPEPESESEPEPEPELEPEPAPKIPMGGPKTIDMVRRPVHNTVPTTKVMPNGQIVDATTHPANGQATNLATAGMMGVVTDMNGMAIPQNNLDPTNRPMEQAPIPEPPKPKKKKTWLIVGMIVSLFIAVGAGIAAALIALNTPEEDKVALAINKLINGEAPNNLAISGKIDIDVKDPSSLVSSLKIDINSEIATKSLINSSSAAVEADMKNGGTISLEFGEVYAANGDLYLKIDGVEEITSDPYIFGTPKDMPTNEPGETLEGAPVEMPEGTVEEVTEGTAESTTTPEEVTMPGNCETTESCPPSESEAVYNLASTLSLLEVVDGEWLRISLSEAETILPADANSENSLMCLANLANDARGSSNTLTGIYNRNPFIVSTNKNLSVASKQNPLYKVNFDGDSFYGFIDEAANTTMMKNFADCLGYKNSKIDTEDMAGQLQQVPDLYVEIDESYNFTRIYFSTAIDELKADITVDLDLTYPTNVNVPEPVEYMDFEDVMQQMLNNTYENENPDEGTDEGTQDTEGETN